tara:strand:- start:111 stop:545 length:435 start_codon:yes stop_codon:yes gene_type:complete
MAWYDRFLSGGNIANNTPVDYTAGGTIGNPSAGIGEVGYINLLGQVEQTSPTGRPLRPSVGMGIDPYKKSFFDKFDPQALEDLAGLTPPEKQQGKVLPAPGIRGGGRYGRADIPLSKEYDHTYAPNPGEVLYVPRREKDRFAGR